MSLQYILGSAAGAYCSATALTPIVAADRAAYKTAFNAAVATALTSLNPIGNITGDLTSDLSNNTSVLNTRASAQSGYEANVFGLKKGNVKFKLVWTPTDANFTIMFTAWDTQAEFFFASLDQSSTITGAQGPAGNFIISDFQKTEPTDTAQTWEVTLAPSGTANGWYKKAA